MFKRWNLDDLAGLEAESPLPPSSLRTCFLDPDKLRPIIRYAHECMEATTFPRHTFDFCLALFLEPNGHLELADHRVAVDPHTLMIVPPFLPHRYSLAEGRRRHVAFHFDLAPGFPAGRRFDTREPYEVRLGDGLVLPLAVHLPRPAEVYKHLCDAAQLFLSGSPGNRLAADVMLFRVLEEAIRFGPLAAIGSLKPHPSLRLQTGVDKAIQQMQAQLERELSVQDIGKMVDLSPTHLTKGFRELMGHSPMAYLRRLRMLKARELLRDPSLTIKEIAHRVGYGDPGRFSKSFQEFDGLAPSMFRDLHRKLDI